MFDIPIESLLGFVAFLKEWAIPSNQHNVHKNSGSIRLSVYKRLFATSKDLFSLVPSPQTYPCPLLNFAPSLLIYPHAMMVMKGLEYFDKYYPKSFFVYFLVSFKVFLKYDTITSIK